MKVTKDSVITARTEIIVEIDRMWHGLESIEAEPHEIINPYTLTLGIEE